MENIRIQALELDYDEWVRELQERWGQPRYRADQICAWIHKRKVFNPAEWTDLSKTLREQLMAELVVAPPRMIREDISEKDGTRKYLWMLADGETLETVLLNHGNRATACLSTQVGCALGCTFCATGRGGFTRNMTAGEIVGQFLAMEARLGKDIGNIVFMGMGEPLLNLDNVIRAVEMLNHPRMRELGIRHMTISTAGITEGIDRLAELNLGVGLSVSLHAPTDELRSRLMPVNRRIPLARLMESLRSYQEKTGDRVTFEYLLIRDVNDNSDQAYELGMLLEDFKCFVNLIPYNPVEGLPYRRSTPGRVKEFRKILDTLGIENEARVEKGTDIDAACGQLRGKAEAEAGRKETAVSSPKTGARAPHSRRSIGSRKPSGGGRPSRRRDGAGPGRSAQGAKRNGSAERSGGPVRSGKPSNGRPSRSGEGRPAGDERPRRGPARGNSDRPRGSFGDDRPGRGPSGGASGRPGRSGGEDRPRRGFAGKDSGRPARPSRDDRPRRGPSGPKRVSGSGRKGR
jgi:23S rRNA (adenine2503-C2)-methyltransferase